MIFNVLLVGQIIVTYIKVLFMTFKEDKEPTKQKFEQHRIYRNPFQLFKFIICL